MNPKAYMEEAERLRHRIFRKEHEIDCIRQSAEGMVGKGGDSLKQFLQNHTRWKLL